MSSARRYLPNYTVEDYQHWQGDWELWQGIPVSMTPSPFGRHQKVAMRLATTLQRAIDNVECEAVVLAEIDWIVSDDTVVRPDVLVLCGDAPSGHVVNSPPIVAELFSPSTEKRDREEKFDLYQDEGVKYYMMLDPERNVLHLYELGADGVYQQHESSGEIVLNICDDCELRIALERLFA
jgi:Uma2 family endonuclease